MHLSINLTFCPVFCVSHFFFFFFFNMSMDRLRNSKNRKGTVAVVGRKFDHLCVQHFQAYEFKVRQKGRNFSKDACRLS